MVSPHKGILFSLKRREIPPWAPTWMNLEDGTRGEISWERKDSTCTRPPEQPNSDRRQKGGCLGRGERRMGVGSTTWVGAEPQLGKMPKF